MTKRRPAVSLLASLPLALAISLGCSNASADADHLPEAGPEAITAVLSRGADARALKLNHHDLTLLWGVTRSQEEGCGGAGIAGGEVGGKGEFTHLGRTTVSVSAAWDIAHLLSGPGQFKPVGPASGPVAPVLGRGQYPYAFHYDPFTGDCAPAVVATGKVVLTAANGDQLFGEITGGETHKLDFIVDGDGVETFAVVEVTGGTGRFAGATGSFVAHTIGRLQPTLKFGLTFAELLPGGTVGY
jgi:hypothetical protein